MKKVKIFTLFAVILAASLGSALFPAQMATSADIVDGTIWSRKYNGKVIDDYAFSKGLYVYTDYEDGVELPGKYRVKGNSVEMFDTLLSVESVGKINGDKMTVTPLDENGKADGKSIVYTKDK